LETVALNPRNQICSALQQRCFLFSPEGFFFFCFCEDESLQRDGIFVFRIPSSETFQAPSSPHEAGLRYSKGLVTM